MGSFSWHLFAECEGDVQLVALAYRGARPQILSFLMHIVESLKRKRLVE